MKRILNLTVESRRPVGGNILLRLVPDGRLPLTDIIPGQFVEVKAPATAGSVLLRRPISVCDVTPDGRLLLLIKPQGRASSAMAALVPGDRLDVVLPLGNGFDTSLASGGRALLVGGGVGTAPLVMLSRRLIEAEVAVEVIIGGRSAADIGDVASLFPPAAVLHLSSDDGSVGTPGLVTDNPAIDAPCDVIYCCGPTPMMKAVAGVARRRGVPCQVSLENMMACGLGACLCCVEKTVDGNLCVCTDGPVFNIEQLLWNQTSL